MSKEAFKTSLSSEEQQLWKGGRNLPDFASKKGLIRDKQVHHRAPFQTLLLQQPEHFVDSWYAWLYKKLQAFVTMKSERRLELAPWFLPSSSHQIKMLNTRQAQYDKNPETSFLTKIESAQTQLPIAEGKGQQKFKIEPFQQGKFSALQIYLKNISKGNTIPSENYLDLKRTQREQEKAELFNHCFLSVFNCSDYKAECQACHEKLINSF